MRTQLSAKPGNSSAVSYILLEHQAMNLPPVVPTCTRVTPALPCFMKGREEWVTQRLQVPFKDLTRSDTPEESEPGKEAAVANFQASHTTLKNIFPCVCCGSKKKKKFVASLWANSQHKYFYSFSIQPLLSDGKPIWLKTDHDRWELTGIQKQLQIL